MGNEVIFWLPVRTVRVIPEPAGWCRACNSSFNQNSLNEKLQYNLKDTVSRVVSLTNQFLIWPWIVRYRYVEFLFFLSRKIVKIFSALSHTGVKKTNYKISFINHSHNFYGRALDILKSSMSYDQRKNKTTGTGIVKWKTKFLKVSEQK